MVCRGTMTGCAVETGAMGVTCDGGGPSVPTTAPVVVPPCGLVIVTSVAAR